MNDTPTPRTDEAWAAWKYLGSGMSVHVGRELERELTAAREKLAKAGVGDYKADYFLGELTETGKLRSELKAVTEQRDEARKLAEKYRYLSCDSQEEADETLLPWENNQPTEL